MDYANTPITNTLTPKKRVPPTSDADKTALGFQSIEGSFQNERSSGERSLAPPLDTHQLASL